MNNENPETINKLFMQTFNNNNPRNQSNHFTEITIDALKSELAEKDKKIAQLLSTMQDAENYIREMLKRNLSFTVEPTEAIGRYSLLWAGYRDLQNKLRPHTIQQERGGIRWTIL